MRYIYLILLLINGSFAFANSDSTNLGESKMDKSDLSKLELKNGSEILISDKISIKNEKILANGIELKYTLQDLESIYRYDGHYGITGLITGSLLAIDHIAYSSSQSYSYTGEIMPIPNMVIITLLGGGIGYLIGSSFDSWEEININDLKNGKLSYNISPIYTPIQDNFAFGLNLNIRINL